MNRNKKSIVSTLVGSILLVLLYISSQTEKPTILEFGMFAGSNWDVANANSYTIIDKAISRFEEEHPNVEIHYDSGIQKNDYSEWLSGKVLEGKAPDVMMVLSGDFEKMASIGVLQNLDERILDDEDIDIETYFPTSLSTGQCQESQYALPYETVPTLMFVNKTLLKKEGFEIPEADWTWADLLEISQAITRDTDGDGRLDQFGTYNYSWEEAVYSNGAKLFDTNGETAYFTDKKVSEAVKFVKQLNNLNQGQQVTQDDFDAGNVAFMPMRFSDYRTYKVYPYKIKKYSDFQWDCIMLPAGNRGSNVSVVDSLLIGIGSQTKQEELAWEFLKLLTYDEQIQLELFRYSQGASVLRSVTASQEAEAILSQNTEAGEKVIDNDLLSNAIEKGVVIPQFPKYNEAIAFANNTVDTIFEEGENVDSSFKIFQIRMNKFLKQ